MIVNKEELKKTIEVSLDKQITNLGSRYSSFVETSRYTILSGGKRLRPLLVIGLYADLNGSIDPIIQPSLAIELIHTASLIHDDLPALDNDDFRRGKPSCHKQFSESAAILTGDFLPILGFNLIVNSEFDDLTKVKLTEYFSVAFMELCEGQSLDMQKTETFEKIAALKTGALFKLCMKFGAVNHLKNNSVSVNIERFGEVAGLVFQLQDDLEDDNQEDVQPLINKLSDYRDELQNLKIKIENALDKQLVNTTAMLEYARIL